MKVEGPVNKESKSGPFLVRISILIAVIAVAAIIVYTDFLYEGFEEVIVVAESIMSRFPAMGMLVFILLAAASAMLAFYSSTVLVPIGIHVWGATICLILLWIGWLIGGVLSFTIGYYFGRPVTSRLIGKERFAHFNERLNQHTKFMPILFFQLVLPSEIPGYVLGTLHSRFRYYLPALAIAEFPYALGTVYLGSSFLERNGLVFVSVGLGAILISACLFILYRYHFFNQTDSW